MTRVCLLGDPDVNLRYELYSRETSREALTAYDVSSPFENSLAMRTISIGAAVSLLNDLQWYLVRFVDEAIVFEPSVSEHEWLSHPLAEAIRNDVIEPEETGEYLKIYGVEIHSSDEEDDSLRAGTDPTVDSTVAGIDPPEDADDSTDGVNDPNGRDTDATATPASETDDSTGRDRRSGPKRLVEPLYVRRVDDDVPAYDLRDVEETLVVRLTESEFTR